MLESQSVLGLYRVVKEWLELIPEMSGVTIRPSRDRDAPRPDPPYVLIRPRRRNGRISVGDERRVFLDGSVTFRGERFGQFTLTGVGAVAAGVVDDLEMTRYYPDISEHFFDEGVAIDELGESVETNTQREGAWVPVSVRDLTVNYTKEKTLPAGTVPTATSIEFDLTLEGDDGHPVLDADVSQST